MSVCSFWWLTQLIDCAKSASDLIMLILDATAIEWIGTRHWSPVFGAKGIVRIAGDSTLLKMTMFRAIVIYDVDSGHQFHHICHSISNRNAHTLTQKVFYHLVIDCGRLTHLKYKINNHEPMLLLLKYSFRSQHLQRKFSSFEIVLK